MADAKMKRKVSKTGARRAMREPTDGENAMPDVFDFVETDHTDEVVEGVERGRVRAMRWEVL